MTDQTKCPHCGADGDKYGSGILFDCGSVNDLRSHLCEVRQLRAKVAAQQELLKEAADALRMLTHWSDEATHLGHATLNACRENAAIVLRKLE